MMNDLDVLECGARRLLKHAALTHYQNVLNHYSETTPLEGLSAYYTETVILRSNTEPSAALVAWWVLHRSSSELVLLASADKIPTPYLFAHVFYLVLEEIAAGNLPSEALIWISRSRWA